jgi:hypothetical protein
MLFRLLRQLVVLVTLGAFVGAGVVQAMPSAPMAGPRMAMTMAMDMADGEMPAPCQEKMPGCMVDLGCTFMAGLPMPPMPTVTQVSWSTTVTYWLESTCAAGLSLKPPLDPPISLV